MNNWINALEQIGNKLGILACLFIGWMYFQIGELEKRVENLDQTTKDLAEVKLKVASIDAKLEIILKDFVSKRDNVRISP